MISEEKIKEYMLAHFSNINLDSTSESANALINAIKFGYEEGYNDYDSIVQKLLNSYGINYIDCNSIGGLIAYHQLFLENEKEIENLKKLLYTSEKREKELVVLCENLKAKIKKN